MLGDLRDLLHAHPWLAHAHALDSVSVEQGLGFRFHSLRRVPRNLVMTTFLEVPPVTSFPPAHTTTSYMTSYVLRHLRKGSATGVREVTTLVPESAEQTSFPCRQPRCVLKAPDEGHGRPRNYKVATESAYDKLCTHPPRGPAAP